MKKIIILSCIIIILGVVAALWLFWGKEQNEGPPILTNLQVTEYKNQDALVRVIDEMEKRGIKPVTIFVGKDLAEGSCPLIQELDQKGYEIAAFGYVLDQGGNFIQLANLPKDQQEEIIGDTKDAIENCLGYKIGGFRAQRFSQNQDTNEVVKDLGFKWHGSFVINWNPEASYVPYYSNDFGFYVVSMEGVAQTGYVLCDTAMFSNGKTAGEWQQTIKDYFVSHQREQLPFITEFHPYFLADNPDWWDEFTGLLDWFAKQKTDFVTTQQLIDSSCLVCGE